MGLWEPRELCGVSASAFLTPRNPWLLNLEVLTSGRGLAFVPVVLQLGRFPIVPAGVKNGFVVICASETVLSKERLPIRVC